MEEFSAAEKVFSKIAAVGGGQLATLESQKRALYKLPDGKTIDLNKIEFITDDISIRHNENSGSFFLKMDSGKGVVVRVRCTSTNLADIHAATEAERQKLLAAWGES